MSKLILLSLTLGTPESIIGKPTRTFIYPFHLIQHLTSFNVFGTTLVVEFKRGTTVHTLKTIATVILELLVGTGKWIGRADLDASDN